MYKRNEYMHVLLLLEMVRVQSRARYTREIRNLRAFVGNHLYWGDCLCDAPISYLVSAVPFCP